MTSYSSRFRTANIQQLQQVAALHHELWLWRLDSRDCRDDVMLLAWYRERLDAILSAPANTDEKPLPPLGGAVGSKVLRSGDLVVGRRYRVVEIADSERDPQHAVGDVVLCGNSSEGTTNTINDFRSSRGWFAYSADSGTWVAAVELIEDEAEQPRSCECWACLKLLPKIEGELFDSRFCRMVLCAKCGNKRCPHANDHRNVCTNSNAPGQKGSAYEDQPDPTIIHAAEGVTLEPQAPQESYPGSAPQCGHVEMGVQCARESGHLGAHNGRLRNDSKAAQPAGEAQPEGKCARCGGSGEFWFDDDVQLMKCPDCKGTGRASLEDKSPSQAPPCKECGREFDCDELDGGPWPTFCDNCLRTVAERLDAENASLRERLEAAEREASDG